MSIAVVALSLVVHREGGGRRYDDVVRRCASAWHFIPSVRTARKLAHTNGRSAKFADATARRSMSSLADNETRKFWAQNNVAGKKGFQSTGNPASTGIVQDGRPGKGSGGWVKGAVEQMRFEMGDGATEVRGLGMDKAIATELRASLRADGYSQKAGYGRGQEWTTHNRGGHRVIVTKHSDGTYSADSFRTGPKLYAADKARVRLGQTLQGGKQKQLDQFLKNGGSINDLLTET